MNTQFMSTLVLNQVRNLKSVILGRSLTTPSLGSMTLDSDDVSLAKAWLRNPVDWHDKNIIDQFESEFALWNGSKYAFSFMSGRVALSACIDALELQSGDEVLLPGYTCVVVPNAFRYRGIKVVYADIELDTYGLDVRQLEGKISGRTKAILLHHLYGLVCRDYDAILCLAKKYGLKVIEDCAHATGATYKDVKVGNRGDVGFYSCEQSKVFNTIQGGVAVTNNDKIAERLKAYYENAPYPDTEWIERQLCNVVLNYYQFKHPQRWWMADLACRRYGNKRMISTTREEELGLCPSNYGRKMATPIAALGLNQCKKIDFYNGRRRTTAVQWDLWCEKSGYKKPVVVAESVPVYLRYPVLVEPEKKKDHAWAIEELNVRPGVWFVSNIHPAQWPVKGCPQADKAVRQCINFPSLLD